jgi:hypothetical protein
MGKRDGVRAARGKQSTDKFGKAVCLSDGEGSGSARRIKPLDPPQPACRPFHAEKGGGSLTIYRLVAEGRGHAAKHLPSNDQMNKYLA